MEEEKPETGCELEMQEPTEVDNLRWELGADALVIRKLGNQLENERCLRKKLLYHYYFRGWQISCLRDKTCIQNNQINRLVAWGFEEQRRGKDLLQERNALWKMNVALSEWRLAQAKPCPSAHDEAIDEIDAFMGLPPKTMSSDAQAFVDDVNSTHRLPKARMADDTTEKIPLKKDLLKFLFECSVCVVALGLIALITLGVLSLGGEPPLP